MRGIPERQIPGDPPNPRLYGGIPERPLSGDSLEPPIRKEPPPIGAQAYLNFRWIESAKPLVPVSGWMTVND
jgi:hypothetical protein